MSEQLNVVNVQQIVKKTEADLDDGRMSQEMCNKNCWLLCGKL